MYVLLWWPKCSSFHLYKKAVARGAPSKLFSFFATRNELRNRLFPVGPDPLKSSPPPSPLGGSSGIPDLPWVRAPPEPGRLLDRGGSQRPTMYAAIGHSLSQYCSANGEHAHVTIADNFPFKFRPYRRIMYCTERYRTSIGRYGHLALGLGSLKR